MTKDTKPTRETVRLATLLSKKATVSPFVFWIVGDTPLITNAWSKKAKFEILAKHLKATKPGKEIRNPEQEFTDSLYEMGENTGKYGFPAMGIKKCIVNAAHKDKGINKTTTMQALWLNGDMHRVKTAHAGAICDMPLLRIYGSDPLMREDPTRIGGMNKTAALAYRGQFTVWGMRVTGRMNISILSLENLAFLIQEAGVAYGAGEWRNERAGMFGAFHMATPDEEVEWEAYASGEGELPLPEAYRQAAE